MEKFKKFLREYPDSSLAPRIRNMLFEKRTAALSAELQATCPSLVWIRMDYNHVRRFIACFFKADEQSGCNASVIHRGLQHVQPQT